MQLTFIDLSTAFIEMIVIINLEWELIEVNYENEERKFLEIKKKIMRIL